MKERGAGIIHSTTAWNFYACSATLPSSPNPERNNCYGALPMSKSCLPAEENREVEFAPLIHKADRRLDESRERRLDVKLDIWKRRHLAA
jgi:hypothetical protein